MTRERLEKPIPQVQRKPEVAPRTRVPAQPVQLARLPGTPETKPVPSAQLDIQRAQTLELQRFEVQRLADLELQRAHDDRFTQARAAQTAWHASSVKSVPMQRAVSEHARSARAAQSTRAAFVAQRSAATLESLVAQRLELEVRPALPSVQRQADLTLSHVADHYGDKAAVQLARDSAQLSSYAGFKNAGAGLVKSFRTPGSSHTMPQLASAIQRFRDPMQRAAVQSAAFAAFGAHPTYPQQLQRALEERDSQLEVQREAWQRELEPVAQRLASEQANGEGAAQQIESARGSGQPLPENIRNLLETKWNTNLSKVRVHTDSSAAAISKKLNAKALTTGHNIFFAAGTWNPTSLEGLQLVAHEAWHTVQQAQGLVQAGVDKDQSLELEAQGKGSELSSGDLETASSGTNLKAKGVNGEAPKRNLAPTSSATKALQRAPSRTAPPSAKTTIKSTPINRKGGVIDAKGLDVREKPEGKVVAHLNVGATFTVHQEFEGGWYRVTSSDGSGYVATYLVTLAPDKDAKLHKITEGDYAIRIARQYYSGVAKTDDDMRFFVNVLHHINPKSIPNPSGKNWREAKTLLNLWIWVPGIDFARTLSGKVSSGSITGGLYDAVKDNAAAMVKATIGQLPGGKGVLETLAKIESSGAKVLSNPSAFVTNFGTAISQGFGQFRDELPKNLEKSVVKLFTGTMGTVDVPKTLDANGVLHMGLQLVGGTPEQLKDKFIGQVGGTAAINASGEAKDIFQSIQRDGFAPTVMKYYEGANLQTTIVDGVKNYVIGKVVTEGIKMLASMFIPGAGIIQAAIKMYETIKFIWEKIKDITATFSAITSSLAEIAAGNTGAAATKVKDSLVGALGLGVNFLARIARIDGIGTWVQNRLKPIKKFISSAWDTFVAKFKGLLKSKGTKPVTSSTTKPSTSITVDSKKAKSSAAFKKFASDKFGVDETRILKFTDDKTSDDTHDGRVAAGLKAIEVEEQKEMIDGKISLGKANNVAIRAKRNHKVFKSLTVVEDAKAKRVNYKWTASSGNHNGGQLSGYDPSTRTVKQLWKDCDPKTLIPGELEADKPARIQAAERELGTRLLNNDLVKAIVQHSHGQKPRAFTSVVDENALGLGGHITERHVFGMGIVHDLETLAMRVLRHKPSFCPGKAGAFSTLGDANTGVAGVVKKQITENWEDIRDQFFSGREIPLTISINCRGVALIGQKVTAVQLPPYAHVSGTGSRPLYPGDPKGASLSDANNPLTKYENCTEVYVRLVPNINAPGGWYINSVWTQ